MLPIPPDAIAPGTLRPLKRAEYDQLVQLGVFEGEKVELLYGQLITTSPQGNPHAYVVKTLTKLLIQALGDRADVLPQLPVAASDESEPEPDLAVVAPSDYLEDHPDACHLVIEVADSSRVKDLGIKARLYAEMNVPEYWVVDLPNRALVVHRVPAGGRYGELRTLRDGDAIALLAFDDVTVRVSDILPPAR